MSRPQSCSRVPGRTPNDTLKGLIYETNHLGSLICSSGHPHSYPLFPIRYNTRVPAHFAMYADGFYGRITYSMNCHPDSVSDQIHTCTHVSRGSWLDSSLERDAFLNPQREDLCLESLAFLHRYLKSFQVHEKGQN
jgi:hypothetical protein